MQYFERHLLGHHLSGGWLALVMVHDVERERRKRFGVVQLRLQVNAIVPVGCLEALLRRQVTVRAEAFHR